MGKHTRFERARILGARALQIAMGAPFLIKLSEEDLRELKYSSLRIAQREYEAGLVPLKIVRVLPDGHEEDVL